MLISVSGLDGAGKSTLITCLRATLERQNKRVAVFHINDHVGLYAYIRFVRDLVIGAGSADQCPTQEAERSNDPEELRQPAWLKELALRVKKSIVWNKPLRCCIYPVDLLIFLFYRLYIEKVKKQILITDRYFYDRLVDVAGGRRWFFIRLLARLTPTPSVPIYLDVEPEEAYARKREYSVDYLRCRWASYQKVFAWIHSPVVLTNDNDMNTTARIVEQVVRERMTA